MTQVGMWAEIPLKPGARATAIDAARAALGEIKAEEGTLIYAVNGSDTDPDKLFVYELYRDQAAMDTHNGAAWLAGYMKLVQELLDGTPTVHMVRPLLANLP
jgi:quinol monooxygenase YgiN